MTAKLPVLISFAFLQGASGRRVWDQILWDEWDVMLDSGAFTNATQGRDVVKLDDYIHACKEHRSLFWQYINLDVIGDHAATEDNYQAMRSAGLTPMPVFQRGGERADLERMAAETPYVCLGGVAGKIRQPAVGHYVQQAISVVQHAGSKIHVLGMGHGGIQDYRPDSGDASSWLAGVRYGTVQLYVRGAWRSFTRKDVPDLAGTRMLQSYGLEWDDLRHKSYRGPYETSGKVGLAMNRAHVRASLDIQRCGQRYVLASTDADIKHLRMAWEAEKPR